MSRIIVKVEIPRDSPDDLLKLSSEVEQNHLKLGEASPLNGLDMKTFTAKLKSAEENRKEAKRLHAKAELLNEQALLDLGIAKSQNSKTPDTLYNTLTRVRDILLGVNRGREENLNEWGYKVVNSVVRTKKVTKEKTE